MEKPLKNGVRKLPILKKGIVQIYTGDGKGKTTAALGQALRMLGVGGRVYVCQFLKPAELVSGEVISARQFTENLTFERLENDWDMRKSLSDAQETERMRRAVAKKLGEIRQLAQAGKYDLIILDEIVFCLSKELVRWEDVAGIIEGRAEHVELVLTGRGADDKLIARADLVTEMREVKHPYKNGVTARKGVEY